MERSYFWERLAERYSKQPVADEASYQHKLQVTQNYFGPEMEVLEFGCGTGSTAIAHAPYVKHIRAIDISANMIEIARGKINESKIKNISLERSSIDDLCVTDQSLDAVLGLSILHLLCDKEATIAQVRQMLKPGGIFVTSTACVGDTMRFFKFVAPVGRLFGLVLKVFTRVELEKSLTDAGFELDYQWQPPGKGKSVFIVAMRP